MAVPYTNKIEIDGTSQSFTEHELALLPNEIVVAFIIELQRSSIRLEVQDIQISLRSQRSLSTQGQMHVTGIEYQIQIPDPERLKLDIIDSCLATAFRQALIEFPSDDLELPDDE